MEGPPSAPSGPLDPSAPWVWALPSLCEDCPRTQGEGEAGGGPAPAVFISVFISFFVSFLLSLLRGGVVSFLCDVQAGDVPVPELVGRFFVRSQLKEGEMTYARGARAACREQGAMSACYCTWHQAARRPEEEVEEERELL